MAVHYHGGEACPHLTKKACDQARKEALGKCVAMTGDREPEPCRNWAVDRYDGRGFCGQHYASAVNRGIRAAREAAKRAELDARIDAFIAWTKDHPSVWDAMPRERLFTAESA